MHHIMREYYSWVTNFAMRAVPALVTNGGMVTTDMASTVEWCNDKVSQLCSTTLAYCLHQYDSCKAVCCQVRPLQSHKTFSLSNRETISLRHSSLFTMFICDMTMLS